MKDYIIKHKVEDNRLILAISGSVDSFNLPDLIADYNIIREQYKDLDIVFDCNNLKYISSTGLRFFLKVSKIENNRIKLIHVSPAVYERFEMVGFTEFFDIAKDIIDISETNFTKVGEGGGIEIYVHEDTLLKLYSADKELKDIELERDINHLLLRNEIPTLISYDIVLYRNRYGLLYEKNNEAITVAEYIEKNPYEKTLMAGKMGKLWKKIHSIEPNIRGIGNVYDLNNTLIEDMKELYTYEEIKILHKLIEDIHKQDTLLYYYFNPEHIFVYKNELCLINMTNIITGNPLFDFARAYKHYQRDPEFWKTILYSYFNTGNIKRKIKTIEFAALLGEAFLPASARKFGQIDLSKEKVDACINEARKLLFPNVDQISTLFKQYK